MKKLLALLLAGIMVFAFVSCGKDEGVKGSDAKSQSSSNDQENIEENKPEAEAEGTFDGEWIGVGGDTYGIVMTAEDAGKYTMEISGNKATLTVDGTASEVKCEVDGDKVTMSEELLDMSFEGTHKDGAIYFEDFMCMGIKIYFAKEGTPAADPALYIPEADKAMVGTWKSYAVTDILEEDVSDVVAPDSLTLTFKGDYTVDITYGEETVTGETWTLYDGYGYLSDSEYGLDWDVKDDEIVVSYYNNDEYYYFTCAKE